MHAVRKRPVSCPHARVPEILYSYLLNNITCIYEEDDLLSRPSVPNITAEPYRYERQKILSRVVKQACQKHLLDKKVSKANKSRTLLRYSIAYHYDLTALSTSDANQKPKE